MREYSFIIAAGGQGTRLGGKKQFMSLGNREWEVMFHLLQQLNLKFMERF